MRALLLIVFMFGAASTIGAEEPSDPWNVPFANDTRALYRAAVEATQDSNASVVILLEESRYEFDSEGRRTSTYRLVYRILQQPALKGWSSIRSSYKPWYQERPEARARIYKPDSFVDLDTATLADSEVYEGSTTFGDDRQVRAPLPAMQVGAVVEYQFTTKGRSEFFESGTQYRTFVGFNNTPCLQTRIVLDHPTSLPLKYRSVGLQNVTPQEQSLEGAQRKRVTFQIGFIDPLTPAEQNLHPDIPPGPFIGYSTGRDWESVAQTYSEIVDEKIADFDAAELSSELAGDETNPRSVANRFLLWIYENIRYTGVQIGRGSIEPRSPADTIARRFGDCKDQAVLLVALLRARGIPSHVVLLDSGNNHHLDANLPGFGFFDHAIVLAQSDEPIWIDPTSRYSAAGSLPWSDQGRFALVARKGEKELTRLPRGASSDNTVSERTTYRLPHYGRGTVKEVTTATGDQARQYRLGATAESGASSLTNYKNYFCGTYDSPRLESHSATSPQDLASPFTLTLEGSQAGVASSAGGSALVKLSYKSLLDLLPDTILKADLSQPLKRDYILWVPFRYTAIHEIVPPAGWLAGQLPADQHQEIGEARFTKRHQANENNTITVTYEFDTGPRRRLSTTEHLELATEVRRLLESPTAEIHFQLSAQKLVNEGKFREALDELRTLSAQYPDEAFYHVKISEVLLKVGLGDGARTAARRAAQLSPESISTLHNLGLVLQHDSIGRMRHPGWDREEALEALRKARLIHPRSPLITGELAIALEYNENGERYGAGAPLDHSIREHRYNYLNLKNQSLQNNLIIVLFHAKHYDQVIDFTANLNSLTAIVYRVCALASSKGIEAAVAETERVTAVESRRANIYANAGDVLKKTRAYELAKAMYEKSTPDVSNAARMQQFIANMERSRRWEEVTLDPGEPKDAGARLALWILGFGKEPDESIIAPATLELFKKEPGFRETLGRSSRRDFATGVSRDLYADVMVSYTLPTVTGSLETGFLLRDRSELEDSSLWTVENDRCLFVAYTNYTPAIASEALRRLSRGDIEGAYQWLDWARDFVQHAETVDDHLSRDPYLDAWGPGDPRTPEQAKFAGTLLTTLMIEEEIDEATLQEYRQHLESQGKSTVGIDLQLAYRFAGLRKKSKRFLDITARLIADHPRSKTATQLRILALALSDRWTDVSKLASDWLEKHPDDETASLHLADVALSEGNVQKAYETLRAAVDGGKATAQLLNQTAWLSVFIGPTDQDIEFALQGVRMTEQRNSAILHTLSTLYAETGNLVPAYKVLLQSIETSEAGNPRSHDWYVLGRIAETLGETKLARDLYSKVELVEKPISPDFASTYRLAQRRLKGLAQPNGTSNDTSLPEGTGN